MKNIAKYYKWVKWNSKQKKPLSPMTSTQSQFANWLFLNAQEQLVCIGNLVDVFISVQKFLKEDNKKENKS